MRRFRMDPTQDYTGAEIARGGRYQASVRSRLELHGLRVMCLACDYVTRHWPRKHGRLRHRTCPRCRRNETMVSIAWAERHPAKLQVKRDQVRKLLGIET